MKRIWAFTAAVVVMGWSVPAWAPPGGRAVPGAGAPTGSDSPLRSVPPPPGGAEGRAEDLRLKGKCDEAVPIFRRLATGLGYAISKYNLGECLLTLADSDTDPAHAAGLRKEGADWILHAASAGFAQAEKEAATLCADGIGVDKDPVEADKWAIVYHHNAMRVLLGLPDVAPDVRDRIDAALTSGTRAQAEARADAWLPTAAQPEN